ncbi:MAG: HAD family hydrolase, partial [Burkholderiales bacterium]|nr:HAD family hydrolase [Burkholderiales bacterium]
MTLLLFDIDGTLTATSRDDDRLYLEALEEVVGPLSGLGPWETFAEVTDAAIAREVIARRLGRPARDEDVWEVRRSFVAKWENAVAGGGVIVRPVRGARELLSEARQRSGFAVALATGGWLPTAMLKLEQAGFPGAELIVVSADDAEARPAILRTAAVFAAAARGIPGFESAIVVGDGVWDGRAATAIGAG